MASHKLLLKLQLWLLIKFYFNSRAIADHECGGERALKINLRQKLPSIRSLSFKSLHNIQTHPWKNTSTLKEKKLDIHSSLCFLAGVRRTQENWPKRKWSTIISKIIIKSFVYRNRFTLSICCLSEFDPRRTVATICCQTLWTQRRPRPSSSSPTRSAKAPSSSTWAGRGMRWEWWLWDG